MIGERPDIQQRLREDRTLIAGFVEECLRFEGPVKGDFRLTRTAATVGGVEIPAGTTVMVLNGAAGRDPRRFDDPNVFRMDRPNAKEHLAFGRGPHACPGGPWRGPRRVSASSACSTAWATSASPSRPTVRPRTRHYDYVPTYILRGLNRLAPGVHAARRVSRRPTHRRPLPSADDGLAERRQRLRRREVGEPHVDPLDPPLGQRPK